MEMVRQIKDYLIFIFFICNKIKFSIYLSLKQINSNAILPTNSFDLLQ